MGKSRDDASREMLGVAGRLDEMARDARAGKQPVQFDPGGIEALAALMRLWRSSLDHTCEDESDVNPVDGFICSACGWPGVVQQAVDNGWQEYEFDEFVEYVPRYCPYCGSRLVRRDED